MDAKTFSFEDIVGGLTKMNSLNSLGQFPRTDSENAFQEFLKRIPSSNSLAAFGSQSDLAAQAAQLHQLQAIQAAAALQSSTSNPPDASGAAASGPGGVPRVASLDFFRQLLPVNQLNVSGARPAAGGAAAGDEDAGDGNGAAAGRLPRNGSKMEPSAGSAFSPPPPAFPSELPPIPGVSTTSNLLSSASAAEPVRVLPLRAPSPAVAAAAASAGAATGGTASGGPAGAGRASFLPPMPTSAPMTEREKELAAKAELRRARRMLSNRESARRSRKRKQEHLGELQSQIQALTEQKEELEDELESARAQLKRKDQEIAQLRAQNEQMRAQLSGSEAFRAGAGRSHAASPRAHDSKPPLPGKGKSAKRHAVTTDHGDAS